MARKKEKGIHQADAKLLGITRVEVGKHHAWFLRLGDAENKKAWFASTFPDRPWGGKEKALEACKIKRDEIMAMAEFRQYYKSRKDSSLVHTTGS